MRNGRKTEGERKEIGSARHDLELGVIWSIRRAAVAGPNYDEFFKFTRITEGERKENGRKTEGRQDSPAKCSAEGLENTSITEGKRKGNGRD